VHSDEFQVRVDEALQLQKTGQLIEAERVARAALDLARDSPGDPEPKQIVVLIRLNGVLQDQGRFEEAEQIGRAALALSERRPDNMAFVPSALCALGDTLIWAGKPEEAKPFLERALNLLSRSDGQDGYDVALALSLLSRMYREMGDPERALPLARRALFLVQKLPHPDRHVVASAADELGRVLLMLNQNRAAAVEFRRVIAIFGADCDLDKMCALAPIGLGQALLKQGKLAEGAKQLEAGISTLESLLGRDAMNLGPALGDLGEAYYLQRRYDNAERAIRRGLAILEAGSGGLKDEYPKLLVVLADIERARGNKSEAKKTLASAKAMWREILLRRSRI
jgi:tetratricopeptide (TPR) repeat protein